MPLVGTGAPDEAMSWRSAMARRIRSLSNSMAGDSIVKVRFDGLGSLNFWVIRIVTRGLSNIHAGHSRQMSEQVSVAVASQFCPSCACRLNAPSETVLVVAITGRFVMPILAKRLV